MIIKGDNNHSSILAGMAAKVWDSSNLNELEKEFDEWANDPDMVLFIKYIGQNPVGFANCALRYNYVEGCETSPVAYLEGIYVEETFQKQGVAKELLTSCENWARDMGCVEFASDCELTNSDSLSFHLAVGFDEVNRIICFKKDISDKNYKE